MDFTEFIGVLLFSFVFFVIGYGGFLVYSFGFGVNVGRLVRIFISFIFFRDFVISVTVKFNSVRGGVFFVIIDVF